MYLLCILFALPTLFGICVSAQQVEICDHRFGAVASWSHDTDLLTPEKRYCVEMWAFRYNLALTVFDAPFSRAVTTDKKECGKTGRLSWEVYFQTDRWCKPDDYEYPLDYRYRHHSSERYTFIPDYFETKWTEVGKHYFPSVTIGEEKPLYYPGHGSELFEVSDGKYGYNPDTGEFGDIDIISGLIDYQCDWVKSITGRYPSCFSYRQGKTGCKEHMRGHFIAGRNSGFNARGHSTTSYGYSNVLGRNLGFPLDVTLTAEESICQPSTTRFWDSFLCPYHETPTFNNRIDASAYCMETLVRTIWNNGWYNDFTLWHDTDTDDLRVFYSDQHKVLKQHKVFSGSYGECMQHMFLRDSVKWIECRWKNDTLELVPIINSTLDSLPKRVFTIPLSVAIDLTGTVFENTDIGSDEAEGIIKTGENTYIVLIPFDENTGLINVHLRKTDTPCYIDRSTPTILSLKTIGSILEIETDKPTRLAIFHAHANAPEHEVRLLCRRNALVKKHRLNMKDSRVLNYYKPLSYHELIDRDLYIGVITDQRQSTLSGVYRLGSEYSNPDVENSPVEFKISTPFPNPFNSATSIEYINPNNARVVFAVYNVLGQKVATPLDSWMSGGNHTLTWNGTDDNGKSVASGVYYLCIEANNKRFVRKCQYLR